MTTPRYACPPQVKGHILKKVTHEGVYGAVHLAQAENWVMYHYRNRRAKRFEVGMLEMFDGSDRVPSEPFTALHTPTPAVLLQAYIAPFAVSAVAVTQTTRGMTEKQVCETLFQGTPPSPYSPSAPPHPGIQKYWCKIALINQV